MEKENNNLFINYMDKAVHGSPIVQANFLKVILKVSETIIKILKHENLIINLNYDPVKFWPAHKDKTVAFVDGGVKSGAGYLNTGGMLQNNAMTDLQDFYNRLF